MTRTYLTALLALAALAVPMSMPFAQGTSDQGRVQGGRAETCQARTGGSRMRSSGCENQTETVRREVEFRLRPDAPVSIAPQCDASALTEYSQRGALARVSATISIDKCPAGTTGVFTLVARVRDESGEIKPLEFNETWQRDDAQDVTFNRDYPIGETAELVSVRVRSLRCTCAATAAVAADIPAPGVAPPE
jgi:hypothetical protein